MDSCRYTSILSRDGVGGGGRGGSYTLVISCVENGGAPLASWLGGRDVYVLLFIDFVLFVLLFDSNVAIKAFLVV